MSIANRVIASSSLLVGIKVFQRLVGLISILILARLLTPDDFAIVALVSIVVHFFDILSNAGSEQYIIQKSNVRDDDLNTAWTIDIFTKTIIWLLLIVTAPLSAAFLEHPEIENALYVSSIILLLNALKNPGLHLKKQNFDYNSIFWLSVVQRVATFVIVISITLIERSYWALIIADICSSFIFLIGSYVIDQHRPRLTTKKWKKQWNFSGWLLLKSIIGYMRSQVDTVMASKLFNTTLLGHYTMARDIAMLPSHNIISPAIEPLLAAFKRSRSTPETLKLQVHLALVATGLISIPVSFFIFYFPELVILTLLGEKWAPAAGVLSVMSLLLLYFSFILVLEQCLIALKEVKYLFYYDSFSLIFITAGLLYAGTDSLTQLALARGILGILTLLFLLLFMHIRLKIINGAHFFVLMTPIAFITLTSCIIADTASDYFISATLNLAFTSIIFTVSYTTSTWLILTFIPQYEYKMILNKIKSLIIR